MAKIFISYSSKDRNFVSRLAKSLEDMHHSVWLDEWEIRVGDSILTKISTGLEEASFVAVVLSRDSTVSAWVEKEWQTKYWDEVNRRKILVLPILFETCEIPTLLKTKKYANFLDSYETGLMELALILSHRQNVAKGIAEFTATRSIIFTGGETSPSQVATYVPKVLTTYRSLQNRLQQELFR